MQFPHHFPPSKVIQFPMLEAASAEFSITGAGMDQELNQLSDVFVDERHAEICVVDSGNTRVVVFDMEGFYQYQFAVSGESVSPSSLMVDHRGEILVAIGGKVAICDFRGPGV